MNRMLVGPEDWNRPGLPAAGLSDGDRAYAGARRHSKRVRILRIAVPGVIGLCLLGIVLAKMLNPLSFLTGLPADFGTLVISGSKITMEAPKLSGFTKDSRAYEVTAKAAAQDLKKPEIVELKDISARIDMQDSSIVRLSALDGEYNTKADLLTLGQKILLTSTNGYEGQLSEATIEVKKGRIVSEKPVQMKMPQGTLNANRLEVIENGAVIRFEGGVSMMLTPDAVNKGMPAPQAGKQ